jgi:anti-sigma28 factor (negative regulator of flagellin synthesis)
MRIEEYPEAQRAQQSPKRGRETNKPENTSRSHDRIEISRAAKRRSPSLDTRLTDVKTKIREGMYTKPSLADSIADNLMRSHDLEGSPQMGTDRVNDSSEIRQDKVDEAKQRISSGEYSDDRVMKIIADRILHRLSRQEPGEGDQS